MAKKENYVIAAPWPRGKGELSVYTYFNAHQYGTMEDAEKFLEYVRKKVSSDGHRYEHQPKAEDFKIYQLVPIDYKAKNV